MRRALHTEWTKLRTVAGPLWLLLGVIATTVAIGAGAASLMACESASGGGDLTKVSRLGVEVGQALVAILAVLVISGEYGSGMIRTSLIAVPRRLTVFASKAGILIAVVAAAGTIAVLGSLLVGRLILPGDPELTERRATAGLVLYLMLIALLSLGIAVIVREAATSIGAILGLLSLPPILGQTIANPHWQQLLQQLAPTTATLGATAGWSAAAITAGGLLLRTRDV
ncbi:ABC transporter permease [Kribbella sp. NPDC023855]|uniref:ABC transporter permease n=1 Tax=Kribbella sp. NPDC023855 TaxID=3154698 RepID=UPI0033C72B7A